MSASQPALRFGVISIFPEQCRLLTQFGVTGRAVERGLLGVDYWNPRDFTEDAYRRIDERPFGGGPGMVMMPEPLAKAIEAAKQELGQETKVCYLSPQGATLTQAKVQSIVADKKLILLAGRYEGVDERLLQSLVDEELSIGDYVLSGGELPAMVLIDAAARLLPGALGHEASAQQDSFTDGLLDCPHYTRPEVWRGQAVPKVLLSGNHAAIDKWRKMQALGRTWQRRPELLAKKELTKLQKDLLKRHQDGVE
jgi:tRNA (guanine37-N1)-methyltransferase